MDRMERRKRMIMKMNVVEYILRAGCAVIVLAFVAIIAFIGVRVYEAYFKPQYPLMPEGFQLYDTDTISTRDSVVKEVPKEEPKAQLPASSSSSKKSSYKRNDNMQRFDPPSENDMDDNGMSRYMNAYDDEDWE